MVVKKLPCLIFLALAALHLSAQEKTLEPPRRLLLFFSAQKIEGLDNLEELLLYESLILRLSVLSENLVVLEYGSGPIPLSDEEKREQVRLRRADSWLFVAVSGSSEAMTIQASSFDLLAGELVFNLEMWQNLDRGVAALERGFWNELAQAVAGYYREGGRNIATAVSKGRIVIEGKPRTTIYGLLAKPLKTGREGRVEAEVLLPATLSYRAYAPGYDPVEGRIYLEQGDARIRLNQKRGARFGLEFFMKNLQFPGFNFMFFIVPNTIFTSVGLTTFIGGLYWGSEDEHDFFISRSLSHLDVSAGIYLNKVDAQIRFYISAGAFLRVVSTADPLIMLEPLAPFGLQPAYGFELGGFNPWRLFFEYAPLFYYSNNPEVMNVFTDRPYELSQINTNWFVEPGNVRLGLRIKL